MGESDTISSARRIARDCDLPKFRVRARLIQMNFVAAKCALNYVDGSYIEPFAFDLGKGSGNYTFALTRENHLRSMRIIPVCTSSMCTSHAAFRIIA